MNNNVLKGITLAAAALLGATVVWAQVPPPPVNQTTGTIYDTTFGNFTNTDCRGCHIPSGETDDYLVKKHHALIYNNPTGTTLSCINSSGTLPATFATGCHTLVTNSTGGFTIADPTICLSCHTQTPHHTSRWAAAEDCKHCHGAVIDNPTDGHRIPTYPMDTSFGGVTPGPVGRVVPNPAAPGTTMIVQGCAACHQANLTATPRPIVSNEDSHHGTGIGQGAPGSVGSCTWCHSSGDNGFTIRACEACHGINSLHNIEFTADGKTGTAVSPGNEAAGYGHIGNNWDCQGCHASWTGTSTGMTEAIAPAIASVSPSIVTAGQSTTLVINGASFINVNDSGTTTYTPTVDLTDGTNSYTLTPASQTVSEIRVALPADLKAGVFQVRVNKSGTVSNPGVVVIAPKVQITSAILSGTTLTITGAGFGSAPTPEFRATLGVFMNGTQAKIVSWSDTKIVATCPGFAPSRTVTVNTVFGKTSGTIFAAAKKVR